MSGNPDHRQAVPSTPPPAPQSGRRTAHPFFMYDSIKEMGRMLGACLGDEMMNHLRTMAEAIVSRGCDRVFFVGCGTSLNIGKALVVPMEQRAGLPTRAIDSFEFISYPPPDLGARATVIAISHTGNSLATVQAAELARRHGAYTIGMVGNPAGKLASAGDVSLLDPGGIEQNGPKIRSYIVSCFQGLLLALLIREIKTGVSLVPQVLDLPGIADRFIAEIEPAAKQLAFAWAKQVSSYMVVGSGSDAGHAVEIALKILETIPSLATGFDVEEYTHGPIFSSRPERGLVVLQATPEGKQRCVEAAYAASAVTDKILVITPDIYAGWPEHAVVWQIPAASEISTLLLSPLPAQVMVYYLCMAFDTNPDHATASPQMAELYGRAFPPGRH